MSLQSTTSNETESITFASYNKLNQTKNDERRLKQRQRSQEVGQEADESKVVNDFRTCRRRSISPSRSWASRRTCYWGSVPWDSKFPPQFRKTPSPSSWRAAASSPEQKMVPENRAPSSFQSSTKSNNSRISSKVQSA